MDENKICDICTERGSEGIGLQFLLTFSSLYARQTF